MNYKIILTLGEKELKDYKNPAILEADILEIRLDLLSHSFLREGLSYILKELKKPVLFTYRNPKDSSEAMCTKVLYSDVSHLLEEFNSENNYLDIEIDQEKSIFNSFPNRKYTIIYSYHNFYKTIGREEMLGWISKKKTVNCIYKFAVLPKDQAELEVFLKDLAFVAEKFPVIGIAMGEVGVYSRLFGDRFGSLATYCCAGNPRAPGQINIIELQDIRKEFKEKPIPDLKEFLSIHSI